MTRLLLSPVQSASFSMGRAILIFDTWARKERRSLEFDRAVAFDFALQQPRSIQQIIPEILLAMRAHGLREADLSDLFAERSFSAARERFTATIVSLVARGLINEADPSAELGKSTLRFELTETGRKTASRFVSAWSHALRALALVLCETWGRRNADSLLIDIRHALPDNSQEVMALEKPIQPWESRGEQS